MNSITRVICGVSIFLLNLSPTSKLEFSSGLTPLRQQKKEKENVNRVPQHRNDPKGPLRLNDCISREFRSFIGNIEKMMVFRGLRLERVDAQMAGNLVYARNYVAEKLFLKYVPIVL